ncbi:hypothetical protein PYW08_008207 [Mythimna loreyi]|uniref:Uncharacterized protein n=1 Tax=Mythimna loreyi TaxID=667449 RepID=A0ACC2QDE9_9NEOP|nr:hypothetical protein PYW08_008207 [Mythimna loreyi]
MLDQKTKREVLYKFIKQFKQSKCLWDPDNIYYYNKSARQDALLALLQLWSKYEPITLAEVKSKIQGIRAMYRTVRRKVESNPGGYRPTLWYYKHLNFLSGNTDPVSDDSDSDHNDVSDDTLYVQLPRVEKNRSSSDQEGGPEASIDASAAAFGRSVGAQLHQLDKRQRCIAEKLISDVIYYAKMDQLSLDTTINVKESLDAPLSLIGADPSLDTCPGTSTSHQEPTSSTELTEEELIKREIAETESAVSFIKMETNDNETYFFHDVDEQNDVNIDIVKEELR